MSDLEFYLVGLIVEAGVEAIMVAPQGPQRLRLMKQVYILRDAHYVECVVRYQRGWRDSLGYTIKAVKPQ